MSTRQVGRQLVKIIIERLNHLDPSMHEVVGSGQGKNKSDIQMPGLSIAIEAKNCAGYSMGEWIDDLEKERGIANDMVVLAFREPKSPKANPKIYYTLAEEDFEKLLKAKKDSIPDIGKIPKWLVNQVKNNLKQLEKYL